MSARVAAGIRKREDARKPKPVPPVKARTRKPEPVIVPEPEVEHGDVEG